ncbi:NmrA family NAD(P)-binding protein [Yinghuangia soli]|uniref:NmrA family NAD(P)-binding protein n=1 Tax=Yinghuangia soli TaxID=2908204 RepID=A0AA41Q5N6_9ACTN|nr:NmrA family NAD(P)-binding protein [Yinghuangia soli]MCF2532030.1 NmrA family NAD(P)-binding protein [Yinghuangia soli]
MILVIGGTGHFGRETVEALAAAGEPVRVLSRNPERAGLPDGVEVVRGDLADPGTLAPALAGADRMLMVLPYGADASALLAAAREAGLRKIVFLSSGAVVDGAEPQPDVIAAYHADVERAVAATGIEHTFLRLFFPAVNSLSFAMQMGGGNDVIRAPYADAASAPVHERDVADAAVRVLTTDGHAGRTYALTGSESLTQAEQVHILGETLGRPLVFDELPDAPVREQMAQFMDADFVNALFDLLAGTVGKPAEITETLEQLIGRAPRTYAQWAADHTADFPAA